MDIDKIYWHTAILPALQLELEPYLASLHFESDYHLNTEPLQIDVVIIKKDPDLVIDNPIARIFRTVNVFEYKSPDKSLSIEEFHRALGYVVVYVSLHKLYLTDISLSIILTKKPEEVFKYVQQILKYKIEEREGGIYEVRGFSFAVQIIESKKLSKERNEYLPLLNDTLDREAVNFVLTKAQKPHLMDIRGFVDVILRANPDRLKEALEMGNKTLEEVLDELGITARVEQRGEQRKAINIAQKMIQKGWDREEIAETTGLDLPTVESLYKNAHA